MDLIIKINRVWLSIAGWVLGLMYVPQIVQMYKTKDYTLVDIKSNLPLTFAILGFTFNGIVIYHMTGEIGTFLSQIKSLVPLTVMYIMYFYYKKTTLSFSEMEKELEENWNKKEG